MYHLVVLSEWEVMGLAEGLEWLWAGPGWLRYRALTDLLGLPPEAAEAVEARRALLAEPSVVSVLGELAAWPGEALTHHNDAKHPLHKLVFLADLGLRADDPGMAPAVERILGQQSAEGAFQVVLNIPPRFGGSGQDQLAWMLCDSPSLIYSLARLGLGDDPRVQAAAGHLAGLARTNGWPCAVSPDCGRFRGPGRKDDPCPYATLLAVKALSLLPEWRESEAVHAGAETLLALWDRRQQRRPYMFAMGRDFAKLKAPLIWYDLLHVVDVLTRLPWLHGDPRLAEMLALLRAKADAEGRFTAESVWLAWKDWEFGQKKAPSRWLALLARRALRRVDHGLEV